MRVLTLKCPPSRRAGKAWQAGLLRPGRKNNRRFGDRGFVGENFYLHTIYAYCRILTMNEGNKPGLGSELRGWVLVSGWAFLVAAAVILTLYIASI